MESKEEWGEYNEAKVPEFLAKLAALTKKYGIKISECGCCGSPLITGLEENNPPKLPPGEGYANLEYDKNTGCYTVEDFREEQETNNDNS